MTASGIISGDAFTDLFRDFDHTAFRLEVRTAYGVANEDAAYAQFLAGQEPDTAWFGPWLDLMREQTGQGKRVERVRVIDDPPSDYLRFELWGTPYNNAAGEDIRYLDRDVANRLALPGYDFWLFDSSLLARLQFDGDRFLGVTLDEDPAAAVAHGYHRDAAWHHAETYDAYTARTAVAA